jgi:hypothetical protein
MNDKQYIINDVGKAMSKLVDKNCSDRDKYLSSDTIDIRQLAIDFIDCIQNTFEGRNLIDDENKFYKDLWCKVVCAGNKRFL